MEKLMYVFMIMVLYLQKIVRVHKKMKKIIIYLGMVLILLIGVIALEGNYQSIGD